MEDLVKQLEATAITPMMFNTISRFNQPERILVSSQQTITSALKNSEQQETAYSSFVVPLPKQVYGVKSLQLLRASIPNAITNIPDGQSVFYYYRTSYSSGLPGTPSVKMVRLLPSYYNPEIMKFNTTYGYNRSFTDYTDLAAELVKSCAADPITNLSGQGYFIAGDVSITYNSTQNKFVFTGLTAGFVYSVAPLTDPAVQTFAAQLTASAQAYDTGLTSVPGQVASGTLGYRLGFTNSVPYSASYTATSQGYWSLWRPLPSIVTQGGQVLTSSSYTADSYAALVNTNVVSIYTDLVGGSTLDSSKNTNLLACIPMTSSNLGVVFFQTTLNNPLTKVAECFDAIRVELRDDYGNPFLIPNSAVVSLELAFSY